MFLVNFPLFENWKSSQYNLHWHGGLLDLATAVFIGVLIKLCNPDQDYSQFFLVANWKGHQCQLHWQRGFLD